MSASETQKSARLARLISVGSTRKSSPQASFTRDRLALFGFLGAAFCFLRYGIHAALSGISAIEAIPLLFAVGPSLWNTLTGIGLLLVGFAARGLPPLNVVISAIDVGGFLLVTSIPGVLAVTLGHDPVLMDEPVLLLGFALIALWRAAIVPSRPQRTALLALLGGVLSLAPAYFAEDALRGNDLPQALSYIALITAVALTNSLVIYRLHRRARSAEQLGQYRLEQRIGGGGMGEVFRASHALMRRPVALKILRLNAQDATSIQRFEREVQLTATLEHPNTISIYDFGQTPDGRFFYVMELLRGQDLERIVQAHGALPPGRVIHLLLQAAGALGEAHAKGIIHRDIKPANMLLCELGGIHDFLKILDFGLVKQISAPENANLTGELGILGTPLYLSPEAIRSEVQVDARSDIYSLGCVAYQLVTGQRVFTAPSVIEICHAHLHQIPIRPSERVDFKVPPDLEQTILRCLQKDPDLRPQSMEQLATALKLCRDANTWGEVEARAWWAEHLPEPASANDASALSDSLKSFHEIIQTDGGELTRQVDMISDT